MLAIVRQRRIEAALREELSSTSCVACGGSELVERHPQVSAASRQVASAMEQLGIGVDASAA